MARRSMVSRTDQTILVVDDQEETLMSVSSLLEHEGHRVLTAPSAERALALFKQNDVDLLLVDYMMPRVTGADLVREIRALDPFVQIILQTGYAGPQAPRALLAGMDVQGYHDKAEGPEKLLLWVDAGLKVNRLIKGFRRRLAGHAPRLSTARILLVGGQRDVLLADTRQLEQQGHAVLAAADAVDGIAVFLRDRPDILVVDQAVMQAAGSELIRRVRVVDETVPLIIRAQALDAGERLQILRKFEPHAIYDPAATDTTLLELTLSALNGIRRVRNVCAAQELRDLIVAKLCHELRNSLHVIRGYAEILREQPAASSADGILGRLELASDTALGLAQDYLDLARLDASGVIVRREPLDIDALLTELSALSRRQIGARPVRFTTVAVLPESFLLTDGEKVRAILAQLLANAIKFTLSGEIRLSIQATAERTDFVLADGGPGIAPDAGADVLSATRKLRNDIAAPAPGQGIGLAIALRLSVLIGASLTTQSDPQGGAVFTLSLPVAISRRADAYQPTLH